MATRYQHSTDRSGSVTSTKVTNTSTGKSYTKTYGRRSSGGSSSSTPTTTAPKKYVDKFGVIRVEGGTGYNPTAYAQSLRVVVLASQDYQLFSKLIRVVK